MHMCLFQTFPKYNLRWNFERIIFVYYSFYINETFQNNLKRTAWNLLRKTGINSTKRTIKRVYQNYFRKNWLNRIIFHAVVQIQFCWKTDLNCYEIWNVDIETLKMIRKLEVSTRSWLPNLWRYSWNAYFQMSFHFTVHFQSD